MEIVSVIGIVLGLVFLMYLAFKGCSIIWVAPVCAALVALMGGLNLLDSYVGDYMTGAAGYFMKWFPAFLLGSIYGKVMDKTGSARALADAVAARAPAVDLQPFALTRF